MLKPEGSLFSVQQIRDRFQLELFSISAFQRFNVSTFQRFLPTLSHLSISAFQRFSFFFQRRSA
jgi:hypothetical protein